MKKICIYLFVFISVFIIYDNVNAGCGFTVIPDTEIGGSDSRLDATLSTNSSISITGNNSCGPYVSYKDIDEDNNIYFIVKDPYSEYSSVSLITTSDANFGNEDRIGDVIKNQAGVISNSLLQDDGCPSNLRMTENISEYHGVPIFDTAQDTTNGYFYANSNLTVCPYIKPGLTEFSIVTYDNGDDENRIRHIYIDGHNTELERYALYFGNNRSDAGIWFKGRTTISNSNIINYLNNNESEYDIDLLTACPDVALVAYESSNPNRPNYYVYPSAGLASLFGTPEGVEDGSGFGNAGAIENANVNLRSFSTLFTNCNGDSKCLSIYKSQFDELVQKYSNYCNSAYAKCDYNDYIVTKCFDIDDQIDSILNEFNLGSSSACGLSNRIIKWIANIFKWVKYFIPALVVIITLLDFIKAIGSQNDDDMKKAQSKLVRRLIVAALFFIIPFLIQYTLEAFNLVTDNPYCNLI